MKRINTTLLVAFLGLLTMASSMAIPVTDSLHIASNRLNAKRDLLEQLLQGVTQEQQLSDLRSQIRQIDEFLSRLGKLEDVRDLPGFSRAANEFLKELNLPSLDILEGLAVEDLFEENDDPLYGKVNRDILVDGKKVSEIDPNSMGPELAAKRALKQYSLVRGEVISQRTALKSELELAMVQLRAATTTAEVQKLTAIINALGTQIAATDSEMSFASQEVTARYYHNQVEREIEQEVQRQQDIATLKTGFRKTLDTFPIPSEPALFQPRNKK